MRAAGDPADFIQLVSRPGRAFARRRIRQSAVAGEKVHILENRALIETFARRAQGDA